MSWRPTPAAARNESKGLLETATQVAGLFAAFAIVVYATGAIVLSLRLAFRDLPWGDVVTQLPREFVLSIGAGQVLLPALLVGCVYGLYRLVRLDRANTPVPYRLRDGWKARAIVAGRWIVTLDMMLLPLAIVLVARDDIVISELPDGLLFATVVVQAVVALVAQEARGIVIRRFGTLQRWNSVRATASMAAVYAAAAIPALMVAAAAVPLSEAKVCTTEGYPEGSYLIGETSDRVYLGEARPRDPRLAVFPLAKVEEMFIGPQAEDALCEFEERPPSGPAKP